VKADPAGEVATVPLPRLWCKPQLVSFAGGEIPVALALTYVELELVDEGLESVDDAVCPAAKGNTARVRSVITNALAKQVGIGPNVM
jgi:hypothetical protein